MPNMRHAKECKALAMPTRYFGFSSAAEMVSASVLALLLLVGRFFELRRYRINSDEPQHLHVAWGWTRHLLPYRDLADNHMPLFQLLSAPFVTLFGEHPSTLIAMRALMVPLYLVSVWCTYQMGTIAFSRRVGIWAALVLSAWPPYFLCSLEYRTDNLWAPLWLLCLVVLASGPFTWQRAARGDCFWASALPSR